MADMTFKANLYPDSTSFGYSLGSSTNKWKIYGDQYQQFDYLDANSEETVGSYIRGLIDAGYESGWFESVAAANRGCPTEENNAWYTIEFKKNKIGNGITLIAYKYNTHDILYEGLLWKTGEGEASWTQIMTQSSADSRYVNISGDTMTGQLLRSAGTLGGSWIASRDNGVIGVDASDSTSSTAYTLARIKFSTKTYAIGSERAGNNFGIYGWLNSRTANGTDWAFYINNDTYFHCSTRLYGAVWNDYAEYRKNNEEEKELQQPGRCVREIGDGRLALTTERLMRGCEIISDTFGFAIGQDKDNDYDTPIASSGRVLVYPYESLEEFAAHIGYAVCSGPGGTVSIMTDEEEEKYPLRAIGTISEIPTYEKWGTGNVDVDGRVWIRIR